MRTLKSPHARTMRLVKVAAAIMSACTIWACSSCSHDIRQNEERTASAPQDQLPSNHTRPIAPMQCRIRATVVNITRTDTLQAPPSVWCRIRVDSVFGYGSSFGIPLHQGGVIIVRCASFAQAGMSFSTESLSHRVANGSVVIGNAERNSVDDDGTDANFSLYDIVIVQ